MREYKRTVVTDDSGVTRFKDFQLTHTSSSSARGKPLPPREKLCEDLVQFLESRLTDAQTDVFQATTIADFNQWPSDSCKKDDIAGKKHVQCIPDLTIDNTVGVSIVRNGLSFRST